MKRFGVVLWALVIVGLMGCTATQPASRPTTKTSESKSQVATSDPPVAGTEPKQATNTSHPNDLAQAAKAKPPKQAYPGFEFRPVMWIGGVPEGPTGPGVWLYTKATRPGNISTDLTYDDLLLVKLPEDRYPQQGLKIIALQDLGPDVVRIVTRITPSGTESEKKRPMAYATVKKDVLAGKRFVVVDEEYKELPTE